MSTTLLETPFNGVSAINEAVVTDSAPPANGAVVTDAYDQNAPFLRRQLTFFDNQASDFIFPQLKTPAIIPVDRQGGWNKYFTHAIRTAWGQADIMECCSKIPIVGMSQCEVHTEAVTIAAGASWCWSDLLYARQAGVNIEADNARLAQQAIYEKLEQLIWQGLTQRNVMGIFNNPTVNRVSMPDTLDNLHPTEVLTAITQMIAKVIGLTEGSGQPPNTLLLPPSIFGLLSSVYVGINIDQMLLSKITEMSPFINRIDWVADLETAGAGNTPIAFAFYNDPSYIKIRLPIDITRGDVYFDGKDYSVFWYLRYAGVRISDPTSVIAITNLTNPGTCSSVCASTAFPVFVKDDC